MNNKICFIVYGENEFLRQESLHYILNLNVPEGLEMDYMTIADPDSVYEAFIAGMNESDAAYKVYVNENVFITDADFIVYLMNAFTNNPDVGIIGAWGYRSLGQNDESDKNASDEKEDPGRIGCIISEENEKGTRIRNFGTEMEYGLREVISLDYNIVATAVDTEWYKDKDAQKVMAEKSRALSKMGYKSVVMLTGGPWCLYDNNIMNESKKTTEHVTGNIAVCVLSYMGADIVDDVLSHCAQDYSECGIDIYYYDSYTDSKTEEVVKKYQQIYSNIYYVSVDNSRYTMFDKINLVFEGYGRKKEYDYIWLTKNRSCCSRKALERIIKASEDGCDAIMLGVLGSTTDDAKTYEDVGRFYGDYGWLVTSIDVLLCNTHTLLKDFSAKDFWGSHPCKEIHAWCHYIIYFNRLCELSPHIRVKVLSGDSIKMCNSEKGESLWKKSPVLFRIWQDDWIQANMDLPECLNPYKDKVIKDAASRPWILGSPDMLIELHEAGILTDENYKEATKDWEAISDIPKAVVKKVAYGEYEMHRDLSYLREYQNDMIALMIQMIELIRADKMHKDEIPFENIKKCIYGACKTKYSGNTVLWSIMERSIDEKRNAILESDLSADEVGELLLRMANYLVLLA